MKRFILACLLGSLLLAPAAALAQQGGFDEGFQQARQTGLSNVSFQQVLQRAVKFILGLVALLGLITIVAGGVMYILSLGDEKKMANAKRVIIAVVIGLIVIGLAALIVNLILSFLGSSQGGGVSSGSNSESVSPGDRNPNGAAEADRTELEFQLNR